MLTSPCARAAVPRAATATTPNANAAQARVRHQIDLDSMRPSNQRVQSPARICGAKAPSASNAKVYNTCQDCLEDLRLSNCSNSIDAPAIVASGCPIDGSRIHPSSRPRSEHGILCPGVGAAWVHEAGGKARNGRVRQEVPQI